MYPTEDPDIYTLSSVLHTPLGVYGDPVSARNRLSDFSEQEALERAASMVRQIEKYMPSFSSQFSYIGPQLAIKTKPVGATDDRSCYIERNGRVISVLSGKIDNIFYAMENVLEILQ